MEHSDKRKRRAENAPEERALLTGLGSGMEDKISKSFLEDPGHFAQVCNNTLFGGKDVIRPEGLKELALAEMKLAGLKRKEMEAVWKERDLLKSYEDGAIFALFGLENQTRIHYCMPVRCLLYDVLNYEKQRMRIFHRHRRAKDLREEEYISGFARTDRLLPVFTVVVYYGAEEWQVPLTLQELFELPPELALYRELLADYRVNLLDVRHMKNLEWYTGELKAVFGFLKYQEDEKELRQFVQENQEEFDTIGYTAAQMISVFAKDEELGNYLEQCKRVDDETGKEKYEMCKALEDMRNRCREEGKGEVFWDMAQNGIELEKIAVIAQRSTEAVYECLKKIAEEKKIPMPF